MSFPPNLLTGAQAENYLEGIFLAWGWLPGRDVVDLGYDLSVEPERALFHGARFLVQSKGTVARTKRALTAQVDKGRLRSYFENPHPVFICRVLPDRRVLWVHAQDWCMKNKDRLTGAGTTGVKFDPCCDLSDRQVFTDYLAPLLTPPSRKIGGVSQVVMERAAFLSGLDERLAVNVSYVDGKETYAIRTHGDVTGLKGNFKLDPAAGPENAAKFRNAFDFGMPAEVQVSEFHMTGSPLFAALGSDKPSQGTISFTSSVSSPVSVLLAAGDSYRLTAKTKAFECHLHGGTKGSVVINRDIPCLFDVTVKLTRLAQSRMQAQLTLGFRQSSIVESPLRSLHELEGLVEWVDQIDEAGCVFFGMVIDGKRVSSAVHEGQLKEISHVLQATRYLSKLHAICNYTNSEFTLPKNYSFTSEEVFFIDLVYRCLRGERVPIDVDSVGVTLKAEPAATIEGRDYTLPTSIDLTVEGQQIGTFPVVVDVLGYEWIEVEPPLKWMLVKAPGATSLLRAGEGDGTNFKWVIREVREPNVAFESPVPPANPVTD